MAISIGIRELRQHASRYLRLVEERGEPIEITDRGRLVALLAPVPKGSRLERLAGSGRLQRARRPWSEIPPPASLPPGEQPPSEVLEELRVDER